MAKLKTVADFIFLGSKITADGDCSHEIKRYLLLGKSYNQHSQCIKKQRHYFTKKGPSSQSYGLSNIMDVKIGCFQTVMLEKTLESPLDGKEI